MTDRDDARALSDAQIEQFIEQGFVRIDDAFPHELADAGRAIMWRDLPCSEHDAPTRIRVGPTPVPRKLERGPRADEVAGRHQPSDAPSVVSLAST